MGFTGLIIPYAHAELDQSILEPFNNNDLVIIGKIIQVKTLVSENKTEYNIQVDEYLKKKKSFDMITAILDGIRPSDFSNPLDYFNKPYFEEGNQVLVYLKEEKGIYKVSPYSFTVVKKGFAGPPTVIWPTGPSKNYFSQGDEIIISGVIEKAYLYQLGKSEEDSNLYLVILNEKDESIVSEKLTVGLDGSYKFPFQRKGELRIPGTYSWEIQFGHTSGGGEFAIDPNLEIWSPLKQLKSGIPMEEIKCKESLILVQKYNGMPACVKYQSAITLTGRNWIKSFWIGASGEEIANSTGIVDVTIPLGSSNPDTGKNYEPSIVTIVLGINNTVRWTQHDEVASTVISNHDYDGYGFVSPHLFPGYNWSHTFTKPGVYEYHSMPHPWKYGKIIVLDNEK